MPGIPEILSRSKFYLEIKLDGSRDADGFFAQCQGFRRSQEVVQVAEVTPQKWGKNGTATGRVVATKLPGNTTHDNITLIRGLTISPALWAWFAAVEGGKWAEQRRDGDLTIYNQAGEEQARFRFRRAWPVSYFIADVDATSNEFEIEQVELAVEEFLRVK